MREVSFIYDVDYKDETDKVKAAIESVARYRPHFDTAYALELARKFNLPLDKQLKRSPKACSPLLTYASALPAARR